MPTILCDFCGQPIPEGTGVKAQFVCDDGITERFGHDECYEAYVTLIKGVVIQEPKRDERPN